jgi:hypothetical protein
VARPPKAHARVTGKLNNLNQKPKRDCRKSPNPKAITSGRIIASPILMGLGRGDKFSAEKTEVIIAQKKIVQRK